MTKLNQLNCDLASYQQKQQNDQRDPIDIYSMGDLVLISINVDEELLETEDGANRVESPWNEAVIYDDRLVVLPVGVDED